MSAIALPTPLTPRWTPLRPHEPQTQLCVDTDWQPRGRPYVRFPMVPAGRRSGKTERAKRQIIKYGLRSKPGSRFFFGAPTRDQAKRIYWDDLKAMIPAHLRFRPRETDLSIRTRLNQEFVVVGMDRPERIEGSPWDGGVLDEYANMDKDAFDAHVRPALSDRMGFCWLIGVPEGRNHYYEKWVAAAEDVTGNWGRYTWHSADILPKEEVDAARRDLDALTFRQEYEADFVNFVGQAYYEFTRETHCAKIRERYNPRADLHVCFDFNVDPGVCAIVQEMHLPLVTVPSPVRIRGQLLFGQRITQQETPGTGVVGEVYIPVNSNTPAVCRKLIADFGQHQGHVFVYGDATGGARGSAKTEGSDWDLVKNALYAHFTPQRVSFRVPEANPTERARINAVNSRLRSLDGTIRCMVDPIAAKHVVIDLEGVRLLEGGSGEIDKKRDPHLTHISDALGYYIVDRFPVRRSVITSQPLRI